MFTLFSARTKVNCFYEMTTDKLLCTYNITLNTYILTTYMDISDGALVIYLEMFNHILCSHGFGGVGVMDS